MDDNEELELDEVEAVEQPVEQPEGTINLRLTVEDNVISVNDLSEDLNTDSLQMELVSVFHDKPVGEYAYKFVNTGLVLKVVVSNK